MKIVTVIGARPQFIKAAVVSRAIEEHNRRHMGLERIEEVIIHTGQHYDANMSAIFFEEMKISPPKYNLHIGGKSHGAMTGQMLEEIERLLLQERPDALLVYGDTNSTLAGALAAVKLCIPVVHIEAGLRSFVMEMPEEINRVLTDRISHLLFCPTENAIHNLKREGFDQLSYVVMENIGDVMYDAALFYQKVSRANSAINKKICGGDYYLATLHRQENTEDNVKLASILRALNDISRRKKVILPLHPRTRKAIKEFSINVENIDCIDPVGYMDMMVLLKNCSGVFTDSGGVQKEAYFHQKLCVTLRKETEWLELVEHGFNFLAGSDYKAIVALERCIADKKIDFSVNLYGDGNAGEKIIEKICIFLENRRC